MAAMTQEEHCRREYYEGLESSSLKKRVDEAKERLLEAQARLARAKPRLLEVETLMLLVKNKEATDEPSPRLMAHEERVVRAGSEVIAARELAAIASAGFALANLRWDDYEDGLAARDAKEAERDAQEREASIQGYRDAATEASTEVARVADGTEAEKATAGEAMDEAARLLRECEEGTKSAWEASENAATAASDAAEDFRMSVETAKTYSVYYQWEQGLIL